MPISFKGTSLALALALAGAACSAPTTLEAPPAGRPDTATTATFETCDRPTPGLAALCEAVDLIETRYIDPLDAMGLETAASDGVALLVASNEPPVVACGGSGALVDEVCQAIDDADVDVELGVEAALDGIALALLDPYSDYLTPDELAQAVAQTTGTVEGIGALVTTEDQSAPEPSRSDCPTLSDSCWLVIVTVFPGGPAEKGGLVAGDRVVAVDGESVNGKTIDAVTNEVRGDAGSEVAIDLIRDSDGYTATLVRDSVDVPVVQSQMVDRTGYVRLSIFTDASSNQVRDALQSLLDGGAQSIIVDLRDNPGGTLDSAVSITSQFLDDGVVVRTQAPETEVPYSVTSGGVATEIPVIVLINGGSASASEVMAGALGESGRAVIVGEPSFGKNTVQQRFGLNNGGAMKLTVARWITPAGTDFGETGITPDVVADLPNSLSPGELVAEVTRLVG